MYGRDVSLDDIMRYEAAAWKAEMRAHTHARARTHSEHVYLKCPRLCF